MVVENKNLLGYKENMKNRKLTQFCCLFWIGLMIFLASPDLRCENNLKTVKLSEDLHCIMGAGGNILVLKDKKQLLLVDAGVVKASGNITETLYQISPHPVKMLINTHYHPDHVGGNPLLAKDATIVSHENCKKSMIKPLIGEQTPESIGAPQKTYKDKKELKFGKEKIKLLHFGPGHTNGDTVVLLIQHKVLHTGDLFFNGIAPYIDVKDGSDTGNWIKIIRSLAKTYPDYKVVPGHGPITDMKGWLTFADYLEYLRGEVEKALKAKISKKETMESVDVTPFKHLKEFGQFMTRKNNVGWIYEEMTRKK